MWAIFKLNVLSKMLTGEFGKDPDAFAEFYADEYDKCIKRGGDMVNGVPIMNGNKVAFATALKSLAVGIILVHNHPSGNLHPSEQDIKLTNTFLKAGEFLEIKLLDHIIICNEGCFSFADNNKL